MGTLIVVTVEKEMEMLKQTLRLDKPYSVVIYARMSDKSQNPRSPDQQIDLIRKLINQMKLPWTVVTIYRDDGVSGRYTRKRKSFTRMLQDLKSGACRAQLLLVDTFERLTRAEDSAEFRKSLIRQGIFVLTADSSFQDPTTPSGRALTAVESIRASEDGRIKAHNVVRGKKDAVRLGHWPGGPIPFGFRLANVMVTRKGIEEVSHRIPQPVPELRWIVELIFNLAAERAWGADRISSHLSEHPSIATELKPFHPSTIRSMLRNLIYVGEMDWGRNCTGIVDDVRILQKQDKDEWEINPDYCEPIIERGLFDQVQKILDSRRRPTPAARDEELRIPGLRAKGVTLTYPLSGLVICDCCGRCMVASSGAVYTTSAGEERRYVHYVCPAYHAGICNNSRGVPENWLRSVVTDLIRTRLFLSAES